MWILQFLKNWNYFWFKINVRHFRWFSNTVVFFSTLHVSRHVKIEFISSFVFTSKLSMARNTWLTPEKKAEKKPIRFFQDSQLFFALLILFISAWCTKKINAKIAMLIGQTITVESCALLNYFRPQKQLLFKFFLANFISRDFTLLYNFWK